VWMPPLAQHEQQRSVCCAANVIGVELVEQPRSLSIVRAARGEVPGDQQPL
jgi:hypothetical protein